MKELAQYVCAYLLIAFVIGALWTLIFAHALPPVCSFGHDTYTCE